MKYILVLLGVLFAVVAQILIKNASGNVFFEKKWIVLMLLSVSAYGIAFFLQSYIFKFFPLSKIGPVMAVAVMILVFGSGILLFGEEISAKQAIGVLFGILSIYLILA
ncbi:MAG: SMR family transporter [Paludibacter sp.]|nr:SMR family transporter [Paludibacter sp.]